MWLRADVELRRPVLLVTAVKSNDFLTARFQRNSRRRSHQIAISRSVSEIEPAQHVEVATIPIDACKCRLFFVEDRSACPGMERPSQTLLSSTNRA
jgi:hypothetical protein